MNNAGTNAAITAKEANERAPDEKADSVKAAPQELNPKLTKPGENDAATEALAAEAKAKVSDQGTSPVIATAAELNHNPTRPTAKDAVIDATSMVEDSEVMVATVPDSIPMVMATNDDGGTVSQGKVSQPPSVDQMVLDLKRKIAEAEENKSSVATAEGSVEPAMVSLSALSVMSPSSGPKADEYQPAMQYTPSPGPTPDKNRPTTRSTPSPDSKKKQSPLSAGADESLMHSGRNFDALVGMDSLSKAAFHRTLRRHPKYTQAYLDHAYNIVHDFRKCYTHVLHVIDPEEGGPVQDDEEKKDDKPDPTEKPVEIGSPDSIKTDSPSNQMVTGCPPTPDEMVHVEDNCMKYVHGSGSVDIGCDFEAVDELVLSNLTGSSVQYTEYFDLIHKFSKFFDKWLTVDTVQFYQCWVSRSIGSYPKNIFLLPLDYYQADVEDIFEDYWNIIQPFVKKRTLGCACGDMSTPPVTYDTKSTWGRRKVVSVTLTLTCRRLLPGLSIFSSARLFVSLPKIYCTTACLLPSTPAILSMVTRRISRSAGLPRLTAAEADNRHFQVLRHLLNTPTFY
jgi:hypothetical protein